MTDAPSALGILDLVDSDHRGISALASHLATAADDFDRDVESARLVREIVEHHVACEQYLHPLITHVLADGEQISHEQFRQHRETEAQLRTLEHSDPSSETFRATLTAIHARWDNNGAYLDRQVFPRLRTACDPETLAHVGALALEAERFGPTRPRALAVEQPAGNRLISTAQGLVDATLDALTNHAHEGSAELNALLQAGHYDNLEEPDTKSPN